MDGLPASIFNVQTDLQDMFVVMPHLVILLQRHAQTWMDHLNLNISE